MGLIYMRISPSGGRYIGKTTTTEETRWKWHVSESKKINSPRYNDLLNKAIRKYGENNFQVQILEDNIDNAILNEREQYWIKLYKTYFLDGQHGYNMTRGGEGDIKYDAEDFLKLWRQGKNCKEIAEFYNCQPQTVSYRLKGIGITTEEIAERQAKLATIQNTTIGIYKDEIINQWQQGVSQKDLSEQYNCNPATIRKILHNDKTITQQDFYNHRSISNINNKNSKIILQLNLQNEIIKEWPSISEAARALSTSPSVISRACSGLRKTAKGYKWQYKENNND